MDNLPGYYNEILDRLVRQLLDLANTPVDGVTLSIELSDEQLTPPATVTYQRVSVKLINSTEKYFIFGKLAQGRFLLDDMEVTIDGETQHFYHEDIDQSPEVLTKFESSIKAIQDASSHPEK